MRDQYRESFRSNVWQLFEVFLIIPVWNDKRFASKLLTCMVQHIITRTSGRKDEAISGTKDPQFERGIQAETEIPRVRLDIRLCPRVTKIGYPREVCD